VANKCPACHSHNPESVRFCGECGTQLPPPHDSPPVITTTLQTPVHDLTTGATFAGRYQVIEELGHGGMGRVYKVFDTKIKEKIALKLIKPEIASDKETLERFSNELRLARKIGQRNICKMFDLGEAEGAHFITMEYVHGEDLKSMIQMSGSLSLGMLLSVGKQVCDGLAEAHSLGIIHRDLKPQNIMIDKGGNAKIMDFGIARSMKEKGITGASTMIGTPEYMSPEQAEAKAVDQRSDIYSLGIILYEMATSRVPFEGETALSIAMKHKGETPKNPKQFNPGLTDDLSNVILKCLAKDKEKRYQSAAELRSELDKIEKGIPTTERVVPESKPITSREITLKFTPKKFIMPAAAFIILFAAGIILWRVIPSKKPGPSPPTSGRPTLAVLYFENKSGDKKLDFWRIALPELLITDLSQSKFIRVVSGDAMLTILRKLGLTDAQEYSSEDIGKIAAQARATHVLRGSFIKAGESIVITAGLQKPSSGETVNTIRLEARGENDIIPKVDELTRKVKEGLNLTAAQIATDFEKEAGKITTSSPEALKYYIEGRRHHVRSENEQAIPYYEKAIAIDPEFAMAYRAMAIAHFNLGHLADFHKFFKKALELSARLPENERLFIEAQRYFWNEDYQKAIEVLERLLKAYPGFPSGYWYLSSSYFQVEDIGKAIEKRELAVQTERTVNNVAGLARIYSSAGLYQKAEDVCRSFLQDVEDHWVVRRSLVYSYVFRRQFDLALTEAEKNYLLNPGTRSDSGTILIFKDDLAGAEKILGGDALLLIRGQFNKNVNLSRQNLEKSKGNKGNEAGAYEGLANALEKAGRYEEAYRAFSQYLKLSDEYRKSAPDSDIPYLPGQQKSDLFAKGRIQAEMNSFGEAERTADELKALIEKGINKKELRMPEYILGLVEEGKKNYQKAADLFGRVCGGLDFEGDAFFFDPLARALYESGALAKARKEYEKITSLTFGRLNQGDIYAKAFYMLGKIAEQQGDKGRARENYHKFLDLWKDADPAVPEVPDARKRLSNLGT
jgi:serine/threonine protein kinase/tetratricopeptide (TPR) repeat protein